MLLRDGRTRTRTLDLTDVNRVLSLPNPGIITDFTVAMRNPAGFHSSPCLPWQQLTDAITDASYTSEFGRTPVSIILPIR